MGGEMDVPKLAEKEPDHNAEAKAHSVPTRLERLGLPEPTPGSRKGVRDTLEKLVREDKGKNSKGEEEGRTCKLQRVQRPSR